jgi:hypothetical protein
MWVSYYSPPHESLLTDFLLTYGTLKKPPCSIAPSLSKVVLELVSYHRMDKVDVTCNSFSKMCKVNLNNKVWIVYNVYALSETSVELVDLITKTTYLDAYCLLVIVRVCLSCVLKIMRINQCISIFGLSRELLEMCYSSLSRRRWARCEQPPCSIPIEGMQPEEFTCKLQTFKRTYFLTNRYSWYS